MKDQAKRAVEILQNHEIKNIEWFNGGASVHFSRPNDGTYSMQITFLNHFNVIAITGDAYAATYQWGGNSKGINFFTDVDHQYFMGKCIAWSTQTSKTYFDTDDVVRMVIDGLFGYGGQSASDEVQKDLEKYFELFLDVTRTKEYNFISYRELRTFCSGDNIEQIFAQLLFNKPLTDYFDGCFNEWFTDPSKPIITQFLHHQAVVNVAKKLQNICYKTNKPCIHNCQGLCKESC